MTKKAYVKAGIVGISGYSGGIALELLLKHTQVDVVYTSANNTQGRISDIWPELKGKTDLVCARYDETQAVKLCDILILAVPHKIAMRIVPGLLRKGKRVIDLSGDYRLKNAQDYKKWYGASHKDAKHLKTAVYGLPELYREKIKKADLVSNPGCYPTAAILALAPIVSTHTKSLKGIIIDAKSGISGAGKRAAESLSDEIREENFRAYKVLNHQHTPEIDLYISKIAGKGLNVTFTPHLLPVERGILETIYVSVKGSLTASKVHTLYKRFYKTESAVRILPLGEQPQLRNVVGTNVCEIGLACAEDMLIITSAIDNLLKGASGQAIQNLNIMYGFNENEGLQL